MTGSFTFNSLSTSSSASDNVNGSSFASFLLGAVESASTYIPLETDYLYYRAFSRRMIGTLLLS